MRICEQEIKEIKEKDAVKEKKVEEKKRIQEMTLRLGHTVMNMVTTREEEHRSIDAFSEYANETLFRLQRYSVSNDAFHIWHDGEFGTINGLRLGRLSTCVVEWNEVNAALGQTLLLLEMILKVAHLKLSCYTLNCKGSFSKIRQDIEKKEYALYSDGSFLRKRSFNAALVLLLRCVHEVGCLAIRKEPRLRLPYSIQSGKIGDFPITLGDEEQWTKAMKFLLTHLKTLLAWAVQSSRV